jgi:hypothetical protein
MALKKMEMAALEGFDGGRIKAAFDADLQRVYDDLADRPRLNKKRTVTLTLEITPNADPQDGKFVDADVQFHIDTMIPKKSSRQYKVANAPEQGGLLFNDLSHDNPGQRTLDEPGTEGPTLSLAAGGEA